MRIAAIAAVLLLALAACSGAPAPTGTSFPTLAPTSVPTITQSAAPTATAPASPTSAPTTGVDDAWRANATAHFDRVGETFEFDCPAGGEESVVWGTDIYTMDSSVCTAAVHAGLISFAAGGQVTIEMLEGQDAYEGSTRNGVETRSYPAYSGSFRFAGPGGPATPSPSPSASPAGLSEIFSDDFSDATSGWGTGPVGVGSIQYADGALEMTMPTMGEEAQSLWSRRLFADGPFTAARLAAEITVDEEGIAGLMCGSIDDEFHGMLLATDGRWFAIRIGPRAGGGGLTVLEQGTVEGDIFAVDQPTPIVLVCAIDDGQIHMGLAAGDPARQVALFVDDTGVSGFDRAGLYAEPLAAPYTQRVDDVVVAAGDAPDEPLMTELMTHVPAEFLASCDETPTPMAESGALVAVACMLAPADGAGAEIVEYVLFDSTASMQAAYQQRLSTWGAEATGDTCAEGPSEIGYNIGDQSVGRVFCAPQTSGIRIDWTDTRLNILTSATDFDGSYPDLYQTWQDAGPDV